MYIPPGIKRLISDTDVPRWMGWEDDRWEAHLACMDGEVWIKVMIDDKVDLSDQNILIKMARHKTF